MPTPVKCLLLFRDDTGNGWTETHYWLSDSDNPALNLRLTEWTDTVAPLRAALLGSDAQIIGTRVSYRRPGAVASLSKKFFLSGTVDQAGASTDLSLAAQWIDTTNTKSKITHMRGFWDSVENNGEYHPEAPAAAGWDDRLTQFKQAMVQGGYGWMSRDPVTSRTGAVLAYASEEDLRVTFTLAPPGLVGVPIGSTIQVRFSRLNGSSSVLNRQLLVYVTSPTLVTTTQPIAVGPNTGPGAYNYRGLTFARYSALQNISLGRRPAGKPLGRLPGRSRARPRV